MVQIMNRSEIREEAFKLIYSLEIQKKEPIEEQIELYIESNGIDNKKAIEYIEDAVNGIEKNKEVITEKIEKNLKQDWKIDRISKVDLAILKLAIYEIKYKDIPFKIKRVYFIDTFSLLVKMKILYLSC